MAASRKASSGRPKNSPFGKTLSSYFSWLNVYRALVEAYNFRLGEGSKLEWRTGGWTSVLGTKGSGGWA